MDSAAASLDSRKRRLSSEGVGSATAMNASTSIGSPDRGGMSMESRADLVDGQTEGRDAASRRRGSGLGNAAFVIVDVQNDFISGSLAVGTDSEDIIAPINRLRSELAWGMVVLTMDSHPADHCSFADNHPDTTLFEVAQIAAPDGSQNKVAQVMWPRHCVDGTEGWRLHPRLVVAPTDYVQKKGTDPRVDSYSGFFDNYKGTATGLESVLRANSITDVFICGLAYDYCAGSTAVDAARLGFRTHLISDLTRSVAPESAATMAISLAHAGVHVITTADLPGLSSKRRREAEESWVPGAAAVRSLRTSPVPDREHLAVL